MNQTLNIYSSNDKAEWAHLLNRMVARQNLKTTVNRGSPEEKSAHALTPLINANLPPEAALKVATVVTWLRGIALPKTRELHDLLMDTLKVPDPHKLDMTTNLDSYASDYRQQNTKRNLALARQKMEGIYDRIIVLPATQQPNVPRSDHVERTRAAAKKTRPARINDGTGYFDSPYIPERLSLDAIEVGKSILDTTQNAHQFLYEYRAAKNLTQAIMARKLSIAISTYANYESGEYLPDKRILSNFAAAMPPETYARFEALVISNRLSIIAGLERTRPTELPPPPAAGKIPRPDKSIANHLKEMPQCYWRQVIDAAIATHNTSAPAPIEGQPDWHQKIIPIQHKGDYLRAMRYFLALDSETIAQELGCKDLLHIVKIERGIEGAGGKFGTDYAAYLRNKQPEWMAHNPESAPFFNEGLYDGLPAKRPFTSVVTSPQSGRGAGART